NAQANLQLAGSAVRIYLAGRRARPIVPIAAVLFETCACARQDFGALLLEGRQLVVRHARVKDQRTPDEMPDESRDHNVVRISFMLHKSEKPQSVLDIASAIVPVPLENAEIELVEAYSTPGKLVEIEVTARR